MKRSVVKTIDNRTPPAAMNDSKPKLNFYQLWLGIECDARPDHYQLLGLDRFEADEQSISASFEVRRNQLRAISPGAYSRQWRKLADEVIAAKRCLLAPAARLAYDEHLRYSDSQIGTRFAPDCELTFADDLPPCASPQTVRTLGSVNSEIANLSIELPPMNSEEEELLGDLPELPPMAGETAAFAPPPSQTPVAKPAVTSPIVRAAGSPVADVPQPSAQTNSALTKIEKNRRQAQRTLIVAATVVAVGLILAVVVLSSMQPQPEENNINSKVANAPPAQTKTVPATKPTAPTNSNPANESPKGALPNVGQPPDKSPFEPPDEPADPKANPMPMPVETQAVTPPTVEPPTLDPKQAEELRAALKSVRQALARRKLDEAAKQLAAVKPLAASEEQKQKVELHQQLLRHTSDFWAAVQNGAALLGAGDEFEQDSQAVAVVIESGSKKIIIRTSGKNHTFTIPGDIPPNLAITIVRRTLKDQSEADRLIGAFYAADAKGDLSKAEQFWKSADAELLPLLQLLQEELRDR